MSDEFISDFGRLLMGDDEPKQPEMVQPPTRADADPEAEAERLGLLRRRQGVTRRRTVLTSSQGDMTPAAVQRVSVLGGTQ